MKKISVAIRFTLTLLLTYGVYTETGKWTAISFLLIFTAIEIICWLLKNVTNQKIHVDFASLRK